MSMMSMEMEMERSMERSKGKENRLCKFKLQCNLVNTEEGCWWVFALILTLMQAYAILKLGNLFILKEETNNFLSWSSPNYYRAVHLKCFIDPFLERKITNIVKLPLCALLSFVYLLDVAKLSIFANSF